MKKILFAVAGLCLVLSACASRPSYADPSHRYPLLTGSSEGVPAFVQPGAPFQGVLLKYPSEGPYSAQAAPNRNDRFQVFCVADEPGVLDTGTGFNYVLYVPEEIRKQYIAGGGSHADSGDPFWWYLATYAGLSQQEIQDRWPQVIQALTTRIDLPVPRAADVGAFWK